MSLNKANNKLVNEMDTVKQLFVDMQAKNITLSDSIKNKDFTIKQFNETV